MVCLYFGNGEFLSLSTQPTQFITKFFCAFKGIHSASAMLKLKQTQELASLSHRRHTDWLANELGISRQEEWYRVKAATVKSKGGATLFQKNHTLSNVLQTSYTEFNWNQFSFVHSSGKSRNPRGFCDWMASQFGIVKQQDWYLVTSEVFRQKGGSGLLEKWDNSLLKLLQAVYPEYLWFRWLFIYPSRDIWNSREAQRQCLDWIAEEQGIQTTEQWYLVTSETLKENGASSLLAHYDGFLAIALENIFVEFDWFPWLFPKVPTRFWNLANQKRYFTWLAELFGVVKQEDWKSVRTEDIKSTGGMTLLGYYGDLPSALRCVYPEQQWLSPERLYFESLATRLKVQRQEDWYQIAVELVRECDGTTILSSNKNLFNALQISYPEFEWYPWLFLHTAHNVWNEKETQRRCVDWLAEKLGVEIPEHWYDVTIQMVKELGGGGLVAHHEGSLMKALQSAYPEYQWNALWKLSEGQGYVGRFLKTFLKFDILINHKLWSPQSKSKIELDVYIPELELAFEYQGVQHHQPIHYGPRLFIKQQERDNEKKELCKSLGITLIDVPYWWDNSSITLLSTIQKRTSLLLS